MAYVFRRPWRRQTQPKPKWVRKPPLVGSAANVIAPFVSVSVGILGHVGQAAGTLGPVISVGTGGGGPDGDGASVLGPTVSVGSGITYMSGFVPGVTVGAENPCLQQVIPSYLYQQYANDDDLQALVAAYNTIAQQYVAWLNAVSLPVYTGPLIVGDLLDWVAKGLYGVTRPVLGSGNDRLAGPLNTYPLNSIAFNKVKSTGTRVFTRADDDIFKRVLTWKLYKGDGKVMSIRWLKRRVLRFLLGANGVDINTADTQQISVTFSYGTGVTISVVDSAYVSSVPGALFNTFAFNTAGYNLSGSQTVLSQTIKTYTHGNQVNINLLSRAPVGITGAEFNTFLGNSIPFNDFLAVSRTFSPLPNVEIFKEAIEQGVLDMPFQFKTVVNIT